MLKQIALGSILTFAIMSPAHANLHLVSKGLFQTPDGANAEGPAFPGHSFTFEVEVPNGSGLILGSMFGESNDWFLSHKLAWKGHCTTGAILSAESTTDITKDFAIYDSGTEADQPIGLGSFQAPRQAYPGEGPKDPNPNVRAVTDPKYQDISQYLSITATKLSTQNAHTAEAVDHYLIHIDVKANSPTGFSPGYYAILQPNTCADHIVLGKPARANGLADQSQDGNPLRIFNKL
jgi:hypothetical protein